MNSVNGVGISILGVLASMQNDDQFYPIYEVVEQEKLQSALKGGSSFSNILPTVKNRTLPFTMLSIT